MSSILKDDYVGRVDLTDPNYPWGKGQNRLGSIPNTGTPFDEKWFNDFEGNKQAYLRLAGIVPSGNPDNAVESDQLEAVKRISNAFLVGNPVGSFRYGFDFTSANDVGIANDGTFWKYSGTDPYPVTVAEDTDPTAGDFTQAFARDGQPNPVGSFSDVGGVTFNFPNDVARDDNGEYWSWTGSLPYTAAQNTIPSEPNYSKRLANVAENISNDDGSTAQDTYDALKATLVAQGLSGDFGFFAKGFTFNEVGDVGIDVDGKIYTYAGSDPLPVSVAAGTNPVGDSDYKRWVNNSADYYTLSGAQSATLVEGQHIVITDRDNSLWEVGNETVNGFNIIALNGVTAKLKESTITPQMFGFDGEELVASTVTYKSVVYPCERYTQNADVRFLFDWFVSQDEYKHMHLKAKHYHSLVSAGVWRGHKITGIGREECGLIKGSINFSDGSKSAKVSGIGFFGEIAYMSLPLPVTIDPLLENDPAYFWYLDDLDFGFGFGALGVATASAEGNTNDIQIDDCLFEMRDAVISGGSAPNDEDRPKAWNTIFSNCETRGVMFHGFASIHMRYSKVFGNHFYEHYVGYACDFSLGTQDSKFYSNTGDRLAAGMKSEARSSDSNFRNKFYDNKLVTRWRWENTGAGFNQLFRTKGREVEMYDNTMTAFDYSPIDKHALNIEGLSSDIHDNKFYFKGTPSVDFEWFAQIKNGVDIATAGQSLDMHSNKIYNQTAVKIDSGLQIASVSNDTFSRIDVEDNTFVGLWGSLVKPEFATVGAVVDVLNIIDNTFPNTSLFNPQTAITFGDINVIDNIITPKDSANIVTLGFITLTDRIVIKDTTIKSEQGGTANVSLVSATNTIGDLSNATVEILGNNASKFSGALAYFLAAGGVDVPVDTLIISGGNVFTWQGSSVFTSFVYGKGASTFVMSGNTLINKLDSATGVITRPTNGANSKYEYNTTIGLITDNPAP